MGSTRGPSSTLKPFRPEHPIKSILGSLVLRRVYGGTRKRVVCGSLRRRSEVRNNVIFLVHGHDPPAVRYPTRHGFNGKRNNKIHNVLYACTDKRTSFVRTHNIILLVLTNNRNRPNRLRERVCACSMTYIITCTYVKYEFIYC